VPPDKVPTIRCIAMPADTNPSGDIFGGWLMAQMDLAGASVANARAQGRCVTVAVDRLVFIRPVKVGDAVSIFAEVTRVGRTSLTVHVEAWRQARFTESVHPVAGRVTEGDFTFVAVNSDGSPRLLPAEDSVVADPPLSTSGNGPDLVK
jgi:acyl-CoA thioesterase YciA